MSDRPAYLDYWNRHPRDPRFPEFHPGWRKAAHAQGIGYYGPWEEIYAGFPEHVRRSARALAMQGVPVHLRSSMGGLQFQTTKDEEQMLAFEAMKAQLDPLLNAEVKTYVVDVWQVIADDQAFHRIAGPVHHYLSEAELQSIYRRRVISTVFERQHISASAQACLKAVGQVWVANHQDRAMLVEHGLSEDRVRVMPIPFFPDDPHLPLADKPRLAGPVRFYHIGKWEPRKAQHRMLEAFLLAFKAGADVEFYMKTSASAPKYKSGYPQSPQASLRSLLADPAVIDNGWTEATINRQVFLIQQRLSPARLVQLHRTGDVYCSLSHGEGFDMPAFDAKLAGKRLLYTASGGPQDYADGDDIEVPKTGLVACDPFYGWRGASYSDWRIEDAIAKFREAAQAIRAGTESSSAQREDRQPHLIERFGCDRVGTAMREAVEELLRG